MDSRISSRWYQRLKAEFTGLAINAHEQKLAETLEMDKVIQGSLYIVLDTDLITEEQFVKFKRLAEAVIWDKKMHSIPKVEAAMERILKT